MEEKMIAIRDPKTFCFNFDQPKDVDENSMHKIELQNEIELLLLKCKHGNNIHKHGKQQNE